MKDYWGELSQKVKMISSSLDEFAAIYEPDKTRLCFNQIFAF
ncbi:hypothetical protein [Bacillus sp. SB49]|nr:hypothetical protein [Bacillus sp. SB49]